MIDKMQAVRNPVLGATVAALLVAAAAGFGQDQQVEVVEQGDVVQLKPDHPTRYVVVKGDTLWHIASRFLESPWHWPRIWVINQQVENPHLIYPGDVLVLRFVEGRPELTIAERAGVPVPAPAPEAPPPEVAPPEQPVVREFEGIEGAPRGKVVKLSPRIVSSPVTKPVPTFSPDQILPFLTKPLVVDAKVLKDSGYVTIGVDDRIALGDGSEFYARRLRDQDAEVYQLYRKGNKIVDPGTKKKLGYEAIYLGNARMLRRGDPSKLVVTRVIQEILPRDELFIAPVRAPLPYFFPHAPDKKVKGRILTALNAVSEMGPFTVVSVNVGRRDGMEEGHVLRILRNAGKRRDPVTGKKYRLPTEESGLLMLFRTFERVSYGLVINANQPIHILDDVVTP
ncbi:MAG: LysM peptidoglycan-binding domain-containing protein [Acidiferrobacterales bacterium]